LRHEGVIRQLSAVFLLSSAMLVPRAARAQGGETPAPAATAPDSIVVLGLRRVDRKQVLEQGGLAPGKVLGYRDVQRAIQALYGSGQYDDVRVTQDTAGGRQLLIVRVHERPILVKWAVRGVNRVSEGSVRDKAQLAEGRPLDPAAVTRARGRIDSLYRADGYYLAQVKVVPIYEDDSSRVRIIFDVDEGRRVAVAQVQVQGNTHFPMDELVGRMKTRPEGFWWFRSGEYDDEKLRADMQERLPTLYRNNGYIYANIQPQVIRRTGADGKPVVDLRWAINEGQPAIVNKIEIAGNDITHERVIREAIVLLPGDVFRQDALIRSYQNISNLGFFQQPVPFPDTRPANDQGDVDVIFRVTEKRTGNINFGASVGQGTGLGGFLGLDEPNLFGQGKRGRFQWQFGKNINDFDLSYTDPAFRDSRVSMTVGVHNTRLRYTISDLGQLRRRGGNLQFGFPLFNDRYTRLFVSYAIDDQTFTGATTGLASLSCNNCIRSTIGLSVMRDTRIDLPFPTAGTMHSVGL